MGGMEVIKIGMTLDCTEYLNEVV